MHIFCALLIPKGIHHNRILFDYKYDKYLGAFEFVLVSRNNGTMTSLFVCTEANCESSLRAAAIHHTNEGVSVK